MGADGPTREDKLSSVESGFSFGKDLGKANRAVNGRTCKSEASSGTSPCFTKLNLPSSSNDGDAECRRKLGIRPSGQEKLLPADSDDRPPLPSRRENVSPRSRQLAISRHLRHALEAEGGPRASVLRAALMRARQAGCMDFDETLSLAARVDALIPSVEALEAAMNSGDVEAMNKAIADAETNGAGAYTTRAKAELAACERRKAAGEALRRAGSAAELECALSALALPREAGVESAALKEYEAALVDMRAEDVRRSAETALLEAFSNGSAGSMQAALASARKAAVQSTRLQQYEAVLAKMQDEESQRAAETALVEASSMKEMEEAINMARSAKVNRSVLARFEETLTVMRATHAQASLQAAPDVASLSNAIEQAQVAQVDFSVIGKYQAVLRFSEEAEAALQRAIDTRLCQLLRPAIKTARLGRISAEKIALAEAVLSEEEPKERLRCMLRSSYNELLVTSKMLAPDEEGLRQMSDKLRELIQSGRSSLLPETELSRYEDAFDLVERRRGARTALRAATAEASVLDVRTAELEHLMNMRSGLFAAVVDAVEAGLPEEAISAAERDRRRVHNAIQDRRGAVRVICRIRPLLPGEQAAKQESVVHRRDTFSVHVDAGPAHRDEGGLFEFDACWAPGTQEEVFQDTMDLVQSAVDGYNVTIFAFGQTGAGKTFTMHGSGTPQRHGAQNGICPRSVEELFEIVYRERNRTEFTVTLSMVELYCKRFIDLLQAPSKKTLKVRTSQTGEVYIENLHEEPVSSVDEVLRLIEAGTRERKSRDTQMNIGSSRSHLVYCVKVSSMNRQSGRQTQGKLLLIDLAGSERVKRSEVTGDGLREACEINQSLSALGDVIHSVVRGERHVPYRNHELTQVIQDSLGGTAKTLMVVNISPAAWNREESLMSLKYAQRVMGVTNKPAPNTVGEVSRASSDVPRQLSSEIPRVTLRSISADAVCHVASKESCSAGYPS